MSSDVTLTQLNEHIYLAARPLDAGPDVRAALVLGRRRAVVIDTLACPEDMAPLLRLISTHGLPAMVVNTHADWDHCWGNVAFPGATIIGHRLCRERLLGRAERATLERKRAQNPALFAQVALQPPDTTFETAMALDAGGLTVELHHLPGHTEDCLLVYIPELRWLYAGDCAEDPFPLLNSGPLEGWIHDLRAWAAHDVATVVPAHGHIGGVELLRHNAAYLAGLHDTDTPLPAGVSGFYVEAHQNNLAAAQRLAAS